jgi:hypothetical protein
MATVTRAANGRIILNRRGVELSGLVPGGRVYVLLDRDLRLLCLAGTDAKDGWKLTRTGAGCASVSLGAFFKEVLTIQAGRYPLTVHRHEGSDVVGFRLP